MAGEGINPNHAYLVPEILEEIFLRLPLESILKSKIVCKQWRSILESRRFSERRRVLNARAKPKIMAAGGDRRRRRFEGDEEVDILYLHSDVASRPSLSCESLVCVPVPGWVYVFNPSTGEYVRFPSGPDPMKAVDSYLNSLFDVFPGYWRMGFGRESISGSYKIVRMCFKENFDIIRCEILDVKIGRWRKLSPPPYEVGYRRRSTCVNGSIYWVEVSPYSKLLALDLHTEEWRDISLPPGAIKTSCQVTNLDNRLVLASTYPVNTHWKVKIWGMNVPGETWSLMYFIPFLPEHFRGYHHLWYWMRPVAVSKQGNLFIHDNHKRLFRFCPEMDELCCVSENICVISPFVEDLEPLARLDIAPRIRWHGLEHLDHGPPFRISSFFRPILVTAGIVTLIAFCRSRLSWPRCLASVALMVLSV